MDQHPPLLEDPQKRTHVIVYWVCGSPYCRKRHETERTAVQCPKRKKKALDERTKDRDNKIWDMAVERSMKLVDVAYTFNISASRISQILAKQARRRKRKVDLHPLSICPLSLRTQNTLLAELSGPLLPSSIDSLFDGPEELTKIPNLGRISLNEIIVWMHNNGFWIDEKTRL